MKKHDNTITELDPMMQRSAGGMGLIHWQSSIDAGLPTIINMNI
ncbi:MULTISPECIES: hypothetical protein [Sphingobacterium]|nr:MULTISPECIES: hypothetical protein [Sphingobacterium]MCW2258591.1 hypothetical protein [Sphingobacterium kitahiroshimense]TCR14952.1 hypothetical protein EDF67_1011059 [Sphingobacterium sp. JUb78]